jgi:hypothetical protein
MDNMNKRTNDPKPYTSLEHLKIKRYSANVTWLKGWKYKPLLGPFDNPKQKIMFKLLFVEKFN